MWQLITTLHFLMMQEEIAGIYSAELAGERGCGGGVAAEGEEEDCEEEEV
jgi:hypothetical protein